MTSKAASGLLAVAAVVIAYGFAWSRGYRSLEWWLVMGTARLVAALLAAATVFTVVRLIHRLRGTGRPAGSARVFWAITAVVACAWALLSLGVPPFNGASP
jgi:hypothetical protein